jgi:hypothetical protein
MRAIGSIQLMTMIKNCGTQMYRSVYDSYSASSWSMFVRLALESEIPNILAMKD